MTVHDYRKALDPDCVVGTCSMNNCLYPHCVAKQTIGGRYPNEHVDPDRSGPMAGIVAFVCICMVMALLWWVG